jgi:hypothetical protein
MQLLDYLQGIILADRPRLVNRLIPNLLDDTDFLKYRLRQQIAEPGIMDHGSERGIIRHPQTAIIPIEPADGHLQREAGMEAGGAGIAHDVTFRLAGGFSEVFERWGQEGEVAHGSRVR